MDHLDHLLVKTTTSTAALRKLSLFVARVSLVTIDKSFIKSHLDYSDIIYGQPNNNAFCKKIESIQYNAALAITGAIRGSSKEKLYQELGLEYLSSRKSFFPSSIK